MTAPSKRFIWGCISVREGGPFLGGNAGIAAEGGTVGEGF